MELKRHWFKSWTSLKQLCMKKYLLKISSWLSQMPLWVMSWETHCSPSVLKTLRSISVWRSYWTSSAAKATRVWKRFKNLSKTWLKWSRQVTRSKTPPQAWWASWLMTYLILHSSTLESLGRCWKLSISETQLTKLSWFKKRRQILPASSYSMLTSPNRLDQRKWFLCSTTFMTQTLRKRIKSKISARSTLETTVTMMIKPPRPCMTFLCAKTLKWRSTIRKKNWWWPPTREDCSKCCWIFNRMHSNLLRLKDLWQFSTLCTSRTASHSLKSRWLIPEWALRERTSPSCSSYSVSCRPPRM